MKKILLLIVAVLFAATSLFAENINQNKAKQVAKAFAAQRDRNAAQLKTNIVYSHPMPNKRDAAFYVVNLGETGFVIVSANDVAHPVLGYSFDKPWPIEGNLPSQVAGYLDDLANQIESAVGANHHSPDRAVQTEWQELLSINPNNPPQPKGNRTEVGPLLTTTWAQGQYYNAMTPETGSGHAVTGCVATAMAQIINYHEYPANGRGTHSYESNYGTLSVNFAESNYDYTNMPDALTDESSEAQVNAVAKLMSDCGIAVNMGYTSGESGAYDQEARAALINFFKYSPNMSYAEKAFFTTDEWNTMLQTELNASRPVYYSGRGTGGHAFVCDGYNSDGYYHFNFGWSGSGNTWYLLDAVNPLGMNFNSDQSAILGIVPDNNGNVILGQMQGTSTFTIDEPIELYHTMGHNRYTGYGLGVSCQNDIVFCAQDTSARFRIELLQYKNFTLHIADDDEANGMVFMGQTLCTFAPTWTNYTGPIMSSTNAIACRYIGDMTYDGFCVRLSLNDDSCLMVSNITSAVDTTSVKLSWTENGNANQWEVEYGIKGFVKGTGAILTVDTTFAIVDDLELLSTYDFYIHPICHEAWYGPVTVKTDLSYWQDYVTEEPEGCTWDENGNVLVSTPEQLAWFLRDYGTENVIITSDLDMSGHRWKPVESYSGNVDGGNHAISNIFIREESVSYAESVGFFRNIGEQYISNIIFVNPYIFAEGGSCGVLVGIVANDEAIIQNCGVVGGIIECTVESVGGLVGRIFYGGNVVNCFANLNINNHYYSHTVGGLVGSLYDHGSLLNCYSASIINIDYSWWDGQVIAYNDGGNIEKCYGIQSEYPQIEYNSGTEGYIRDTIAFDTNGVLRDGISFDDNVYFNLLEALNLQVQSQNDSAWRVWLTDESGNNDGYPILGDCHTITCPNVTNLKALNIEQDGQYAVRLSWDNPSETSSFVVRCINNNDTIGPINYSTNNNLIFLRDLAIGEEYQINVRAYCSEDSYSGWGEGVIHIYDRPYWTDIVTEQPDGYVVDANGDVVISTAEGLAWLASCVNGLNHQESNSFQDKIVTLISDIDLGQYRWKPIGDWNHSFAGYFNGCYHTINHLYVNENTNEVGFFGKLEGARISHVTIKNGQIKGGMHVGGICGLFNAFNGSTDEDDVVAIESSHVLATNISGTYYVGGICGRFITSYGDFMRICNSSSYGVIYGIECLGGVAGDLSLMKLRNCLSTAEVRINLNGKTGSYGYMGGLAGHAYQLETNNCYYAGHVEEAPVGYTGVVFGGMQQSTTEYVYGLADSTKYLAIYDGACVWQNNTAFTKEGDQCVFMDAITINDTPYTDLLSALNAWVDANNANGEYLHWVADTENQNGGFPMLEQQPSAEYQIQQLASGWNWYSTYIEQNDVDGLSMLENSLGDAGIRIQGRNGYTEQFEYQGTKTWYGTLTSITNEQMYKIRTNAACNAVMTGAAANPADHPITINSGWNWIGMPLSESASVASAMSDFTPEANDVIKGRNGAATYIVYGNTSMWYGTMNTLEPGQGYMYQSNSTTPKTLTFNSSRGESSPSVLSDISVISTLYDLSSISSYSDNMLVTAVIEINGEELRSSNYELAAFVDNECRGSVKLMYVKPLDRYLAMLLVFGDEPEDVHFVLTDGTETRTSNDKVIYTPDATIGTASSPTTLHFETIATNHDVKVYPNPSNDVFNISCEGLKQIELLNIYGQVIMTETVNENNHQIDLTDYPSGAYMLRIITDNGVVLKKLVKNQ